MAATHAKTSPKISLGLIALQKWYGGDMLPVIDLVKQADERGMEEVVLTDHVIMSDAVATYPYGPFPHTLDEPWFEPMEILSAIAVVTRHIRLSTGILIAPLRPAILLAKQLATLDALSHGRVEIGIGVGWQQAEYDAMGLPWEGRFGYMDEQVRVCRLLWTEAPASFHGKYVQFDNLYSLPFPAQGGDIPILYGVAPSPRQFARIAEYGNGWLPMDKDPARLAQQIDDLRAAFNTAGRDPATLKIRITPTPVPGPNGTGNVRATLEASAALVAAGVTTLNLTPYYYCRGPQDYPAFLDAIDTWRRQAT